MPDAPSLRDTIASAITASEAEPEPTPEPEPAPVEAAPEPEKGAAPGPTRDEHGRFAKAEEKPEAAPEGAQKAEPSKTAAPGQAKAGGDKPVAEPPPAPAVPEPNPVKPPQSWKLPMRELAAKLPAEFRPILEEVNRREIEMNRERQETVEARRFSQQTQQAIHAFEPIARSRGMDAMTWAGEALQERAVLQSGPLAMRAPILARALAEGGQDLIQQVAAILDGQQPPAAAPAQHPVDIQAEIRKALEGESQRMMASRAESEIKAFVATQPEYLQDVWQQMHAVLTSAAHSPDPAVRNMTPKEAYEQACWMNPDVRASIQRKQAAESAKARASTLPQARAAAASIRGTPTQRPSGGKDERSLRQTLEDAVAESSRT